MNLDWNTLVAAGLSGGGLGWFVNFWSEKSRSRAYTMGAVDKAVDTAMKAQSETITHLREEVLRLNLNVVKLEGDHAECQRQIAELMRGPVAVYQPGVRDDKSRD